MPERIQLSRRKGWRKPEGAVVVARPSMWGNPFPVVDGDRAHAVEMFRTRSVGFYPLTEQNIIYELGGRDLACWCPEGEPCHADVLLEIANPVEVHE